MRRSRHSWLKSLWNRRRHRGKKPARHASVERLESRQMMAGDVSVRLTDVGLLHDTGASATDLVTANWTVRGAVQGQWGEGSVQVEFDVDGDGQPDAEAATMAVVEQDSPSYVVFSFDPRDARPEWRYYQGDVTVAFRARVSESGSTVYVTSWESFGFQAELPPPAEAVVETLRLEKDTGASDSDRVTWHAVIQGTIATSSSDDDAPPDSGGGDGSGGDLGSSGGSGGNLGGSGGAWGGSGDMGSGGWGGSSGPSSGGGGSSGSNSSGSSFPSSPGSSGGSYGGSYGSPSGSGSGYSSGGSQGSDNGGGTSGNGSSDNNTLPPFLAHGSLRASRRAIEWDWNSDDVVDARTWLENNEPFSLDVNHLPYAIHTVRARVLEWNSTFGTFLLSPWKELTFQFIAAPAPQIVSLALVEDTGDPQDGVTANSTLKGQLAGEAEDIGGAILYWDWTGDRRADAQSLADESGAFTFRPRGMATGNIEIAVRSSRWDPKAQAEAFGEWKTISFTYSPPGPPPVARLDYLPADAGSSGGSTLVGYIAEPLSDTVIEFDQNTDGLADTFSLSQSDGSFSLAMPLEAGRHTVHVRTRRWDEWDRTERVGDWKEFSLNVTAHPVTPVALSSLALLRDTGVSDSDRVTSDNRIVGTISTAPVQRWTWVETDQDGDGQSDFAVLAAQDGTFLLTPTPADYGSKEIRLRAAGLDEASGQITRTAWTTFRWQFAPDPVVAPPLTDVRLVVDTGTPNDAVTSVPWIEGRVGIVKESSSLVEVDVDGDRLADSVVVPDATGRFEVQLNQVANGQLIINLRSVRWDPLTAQTLVGEWHTVPFTYEDAAREPAQLVNLASMPGEELAERSAVITGRVALVVPDPVTVEVDVDRNDTPDVTATPDENGYFRLDVPSSSTTGFVVQIRTKKINDQGQIIYGPWKSLTVTPPGLRQVASVEDAPYLERIRDLRLVKDTGNSDRDGATSDARVQGRVDAATRAGRIVEWDLDGDAIAEGTVTSDAEGAFTIDPSPESEGLVRIAVRIADSQGITATPWHVLQFVYASNPDSDAMQQLARVVAAHQQARQAAVDEYLDGLESAIRQRHSQLQHAAAERNLQHQLHSSEQADAALAAQREFYNQVARADQQFAEAMQGATRRFAERLAQWDGDATAYALPDLTWPDVPPDGRGTLPSKDTYYPPVSMELPRITVQNARFPSQLTSQFQRTRQSAEREFYLAQRARLEHERTALDTAEANYLLAVQQARQVWTSKIRQAQDNYQRRLQAAHPTIDLLRAEMAFQQAAQRGENLYAAALEIHRLLLASKLVPLQEALNAAISAAHQQYERDMQELSDFYARNPPSYPMEYSDFEKAWRKRAFSRRETTIADAYLAFDRAVAEAYRTMERQDAEALFQRDAAVLAAYHRLRQTQLQYAIWVQQNHHDAWSDLERELLTAEDTLARSLAAAGAARQRQVIDALYRSRLQQVDNSKRMALVLADALRQAWQDGPTALPPLPEIQLAYELDRNQAQYQEQLAQLIAALEADAAAIQRTWQEAIARAEEALNNTQNQAAFTRNSGMLQAEVSRRQKILDAAAVEAQQNLSDWAKYRHDLIDLRRTRDLETADANYQYAINRAQAHYDHRIQVRDIYLDYMGEMKDTPIEVPLAEASRRLAHRLAYADNAHRHDRLSIDERWSDATLAALLAFRLQVHQWGEQRAVAHVYANHDGLVDTVRYHASYTEDIAQAEIQYELAASQADQARDVSMTRLDLDYGTQRERLAGSANVADAAALERFGQAASFRLLQQVSTWAVGGGAPQPWTQLYSSLAQAAAAATNEWYAIQTFWTQAQASANYQRASGDAARILLAVRQQVQAYATFLIGAATALGNYYRNSAAVYVQAATDSASASQTSQRMQVSATRQYEDRRLQAEIDHDEAVRDAWFQFEHDAADALLALKTEQTDEAGYVAMLESARRQQRVAEAAAHVTLVSSSALAYETWVRDVSSAAVSEVRRLSSAAVQETADDTTFYNAAVSAQLHAWQVWQAQVDQTNASLAQQLAASYATWTVAITTDASTARGRDGANEFRHRLAVEAADEAFQAAWLARDAAARQEAAGRSGDLQAAGGRLPAALLRYQAAVAQEDSLHAQRVAEASQRRRQGQESAYVTYLNTVNAIGIAEATDITSAYEEWILGQTSAVTHYGADIRRIIVTFFNQQQASQGAAHVSSVAAYARWGEALAQGQATLAVELAKAGGTFDIQVAQAAADLYIAGESADGIEGRDPASLTPAQRAYLQAVQAAQAQWIVAVRQAAVNQATHLGDAWVNLQTDLGTALQSHAQAMVAAERQAAATWGGASTQFSILITNAARRYVDRLAAATESRALKEASAKESLLSTMSQVELAHQQRVGASEALRATQLAQAEVTYFIESTPGDGTAADVRRHWLEQLTDEWTTYRGRLAQADASYRLDVTRTEGDHAVYAAEKDKALVAALAAAHRNLAKEFVDAISTHQITTVAENNRLIDIAAQADGTRKIAYADAMATHDIAVAKADRDLWIATAQAWGSADAAAETRHKETVAHATRQASYAFADADHTWRSIMTPAEVWHAQQLVNATALLEKQLAGAEATAQSAAAAAQTAWTVSLADLEADRAAQLTAARNQWRLDRASAEAVWLAAYLNERAMAVADFANANDRPYYRYQEALANVTATWWQLEQPHYLAWIQGQNHIDLLYTLDVGREYRDLATDWAAAYEARTSTRAQANATLRQDYADARMAYTQLLAVPVQQTESMKSDAERQYRYDVADAQFALNTGISWEEYRRLLAEAEARRAAANAAADAYFAQKESQAADTLRRLQATADADHRAALLQSDHTWAKAVQAAFADWTASVAQLAARRNEHLAQLNATYQQQHDRSWAQALADWQSDENLPWLVRDQEIATAHAERSALRSGAQLALSQSLAQAQQRFLEQEGLADQQRSERHERIASQFLQDQQSLYTTLLEKQTLADRDMAASGLLVAGSPWGTLLPELGFWLPTGSWGPTFQLHENLGPDDLSGVLAESLADVYAGGVSLPHAGNSTGMTVAYPPAHDPMVSRLASISVPPPSWLQLPTAPAVQANQRPGEYWERMQLEAQADVEGGMYSAPENGRRSSIAWFVQDLGLMARYPLESLRGAGAGTVTSAKVFVNGSATTLRNFVTLGFNDSPWEILKVTETDRFYGYDAAFGIMRISQEVLLGAIAGKVATTKITGWGTVGVHGLRYWDLAQNGVSFGRGTYGIAFGDGLTIENAVQTLGGGMGFGGHAAAAIKKLQWARIAKAAARLNQDSPYRIGVAVVLSDTDDMVGHVSVVFHNGGTHWHIRGVYSRENINMHNWKDRLRFLFGGERYGFHGSIEDDTWIWKIYGEPDPDRTSKLIFDVRWFHVSRSQYIAALQYADRMEQLANEGALRYHLFNQCAVFARRTLEAAGVKPFYTLAYPPYIYRKMRWIPKRP